jgi:spore photoproduct lyase
VKTSSAAPEPGRTALFSQKPFIALSKEEQRFIIAEADELRLSYQQTRKVIETAADLHQWNSGPLKLLWNRAAAEGLRAKERSRAVLADLEEKISLLRSRPIVYGEDPVTVPPASYTCVLKEGGEENIMGRCPVAGEKTRCCNLLTLDAVQQCGYGCSYCSIQSFYEHQHIYFYKDLRERLRRIRDSLDPDTVYHIGTGQSSDSLMWGNRNGLLEDLFEFARSCPNVILELKTKSAVTEWSRTLAVPPNVITTWSLNAPTVIRHEEHRTASLEARIAAAQRIRDRGGLVGFHFHPMVCFEGWEEEYTAAAETLQDRFDPELTVMVSIGTLTFIRPVLKKLRETGIPSKVLQIPLSDSAGKFTYPEETKLRLFSHLFNSFSREWQKKVFFYLCMEPHTLWERVLGRSYADNNAFEADMKSAYMHKVMLARELKTKYTEGN